MDVCLGNRPGDQNYSRLSVNTALVADVTSVVKVGRAHFLPPPKVDSRVIKLTPIASRALPDDPRFFQVRRLSLLSDCMTAWSVSDCRYAYASTQRFDAMLRVCFLRKNKTLRALLLSKTARAHMEPLDESDKDAMTARIEAALSACDLASSRAVQIPVDQFLRCVLTRSLSPSLSLYRYWTSGVTHLAVVHSLQQALAAQGVVFRPSTTRHFRD